jgi:hypothetical protein
MKDTGKEYGKKDGRRQGTKGINGLKKGSKR